MANTRSRTRKLKNICDNECSASWSNLNHDLLLLIMMRMGVFDFIVFSCVCKSWRSVAISSWNKFMVSKQPMRLSISTRSNKKKFYLQDYTRRKLKTTIPHSNGRYCVGVTCGYVIFFGRYTYDFWLVNPFTRKELHFPCYYFGVTRFINFIKGILVFSPSMSGWVFVVITESSKVAFSLPGAKAWWFCVKPSYSIHDFHFFKGKIYTLNTNNCLSELRLNTDPTLTLLEMKNIPSWSESLFGDLKFVSSRENLYVINVRVDVCEAYEVDFDEMKWVNMKRTVGEYSVFLSYFKCVAAIKQDTWAHPWTRYEMLNYSDGYNHHKHILSSLTTNMWYFPHDCLIVDDSDMKNGAMVNTLEE